MSTAFADPIAAVAQARPEPNRDRWGRYLIPDPVTGDRRAWTRATTFAKSIADTYNLGLWQQRMTGLGLARRPDLIAAIASTDPDNRDILNDLCDKAKEHAGASSPARLGTALHAFAEQVDAGQTVDIPAPWDADIAAYRAKMTAAEVTFDPAHIERIVIVPEFGVAGTFDRLALRSTHRLLEVGDLKTGRDLAYSWAEIAVQLALYAHGTHIFDVVTGELTPMPPVDLDVALVMHLPVGRATCDLYEVDIAAGWETARLCEQVRAWRKRKNLARLVIPVQIPAALAAVAPTEDPVTIAFRPGVSRTPADLVSALTSKLTITEAGCWEFTGQRDQKGYGRISAGPSKVLAHRLAWTLRYDDPGEMCVLHRCDNPPCCNPEHLFLGTRADNNADMNVKGRGAVDHLRQVGEDHWKAKLTVEQVEEIRRRGAVGENQYTLAEEFGVGQSQIWRIIHGKSWAPPVDEFAGLPDDDGKPQPDRAERTTYLRDRIITLDGLGYGQTLAGLWPTDIPTFAQRRATGTGLHSNGELDRIEAALIEAEKLADAPFPDPDPTDPRQQHVDHDDPRLVALRERAWMLPADQAVNVPGVLTGTNEAALADLQGYVTAAEEVAAGRVERWNLAAAAALEHNCTAALLRETVGAGPPGTPVTDNHIELADLIADALNHPDRIVVVHDGTLLVDQPRVLLDRYGGRTPLVKAAKDLAERLGRDRPRSADDALSDLILVAALLAT